MKMTFFGRVLSALPIAGVLLLASCGGGDGGTVQGDKQSGQGIAVGEPSPNAKLEIAPFVALARNEACADVRNNLYVIDQAYVFWERVGKCADNSYAQHLFGAKPEALLCSNADSIIGPRSSCNDDKARAMFELIQQNSDKPDLGLGAGHKVEAVDFLAPNGSSMVFTTVASEAMSGIRGARNVVIRDEAALAALWTEHLAGQKIAKPMPKVDFSRYIVLGAFAGESGGCSEFGIRHVKVANDKVVVEVARRDINPVAICVAVVSSPFHLVTVERKTAEVEFVKSDRAYLDFKEIENSTRSQVQTAQNYVIREAARWQVLWNVHNGNDNPAPDVDFSKQMVLAVFLGKRQNGCYSTEIDDVSHADGKLLVSRIDWQPGEGSVCTLAIVSPAHFIAVDRSDEPVEFASQVRYLR